MWSVRGWRVEEEVGKPWVGDSSELQRAREWLPRYCLVIHRLVCVCFRGRLCFTGLFKVMASNQWTACRHIHMSLHTTTNLFIEKLRWSTVTCVKNTYSAVSLILKRVSGDHVNFTWSLLYERIAESVYCIYYSRRISANKTQHFIHVSCLNKTTILRKFPACPWLPFRIHA